MTECCATSASAGPTSCARRPSIAGGIRRRCGRAPAFVGPGRGDILPARRPGRPGRVRRCLPVELPIYQVDAFASRLFAGNPAAVCPLEEWLPAPTMQAIAAENNLAETAFFVPQGDGYLLRWFTPTVEVDLCGHATLAAGYVVTQLLAPHQRSVTCDTLKAGPLDVTRDGDMLAMAFP